ncbi:hypothetical protein NARC_130018 [Candidatus Nitrosocosmicus arcticus]|uniref:Uncharacterized protein n=1 Tax=Candidatus Nitrosocosmicus arcticus TaxID=2035267 RepID=A0A557SSU2_9ARCH|nr:hypothetical protein NARC_130018 [Candidatus Nitrosocosmicus arcticus]
MIIQCLVKHNINVRSLTITKGKPFNYDIVCFGISINIC